MKGRDAYAKTLGDFAAGKIDLLVGHPDDRQGARFSPRDLRGRDQRRPGPCRFPTSGPASGSSSSSPRFRGAAAAPELHGEVFVQTAGAVPPRHPVRPATHDYAGFASRSSNSGAASTIHPTSGSSSSWRGAGTRRRPFSSSSSWRRRWNGSACPKRRSPSPRPRRSRASRSGTASSFPPHPADHGGDAAPAPPLHGPRLARRHPDHHRRRSGRFALNCLSS